MRLIVLGVLTLALLGLGCSLERCAFTARCVGDSQMDRCIINSNEEPEVTRSTCSAPNAACLQVTPDEQVRCVHAPVSSCDASFVDRCEGTQRVYCDEAFGWVQAVDCVKLGSPGCHIDAPSSKAVCD